jgi:Bacterial PH domain
MVLMIYLLCTIWFHTRYKIEEDTLQISYGPYRKIIHIRDISSIRYTTNPFVAPALSMHRVEISYCKYGTISISPQDKKAFIQQLQAVNSQIQIRT